MRTRPPAVAGFFYPADEHRLSADLARYLEAASAPPFSGTPKAIIAPHAGYVYSGPVAATAYATLRPASKRLRRVVLLGPAHRVAFRGLAAPGVDAFVTPLGPVPIDRPAIEAIAALPQVEIDDEPHREEHSLEVQLPFLQTVLDRFRLVPLVVGASNGEEVAEVLDRLWQDGETEIVVSSDLSHYHDYETARRIDAATAEAIETLRPEAIGQEQACGRIPIAGLLTAARRRGMRVERLDLRNSGDTAGPRDRVVGYGAWAVLDTSGTTRAEGIENAERTDEATACATDRELLARNGSRLLAAARMTIRHALDKGRPPKVDLGSFPPELREERATFVTLTREGRLRGCIGTIEPHRPLIVDLVDNAYRAAFKDPRFPPLRPEEERDLGISISLLSPLRELKVRDEEDLLDRLRPGRDGLVIADQGRRGVFLPQVWESLPDRREFLAHLREKAGLARDHWSEGMRVWRFTTMSIKSVPEGSAGQG